MLNKLDPNFVTKKGRPVKFSTPEDLYKAFEDYKTHMETPAGFMIKYELDRKTGFVVKVPLKIPYTLHGFTRFCGVNITYFNDFKDRLKGQSDPISLLFSEVLTCIEGEIYENKLSGSAVGLFNHNIIARDLGLIERKQTEQVLTINQMTEEEKQNRIQELTKKALEE